MGSMMKVVIFKHILCFMAFVFLLIASTAFGASAFLLPDHLREVRKVHNSLMKCPPDFSRSKMQRPKVIPISGNTVNPLARFNGNSLRVKGKEDIIICKSFVGGEIVHDPYIIPELLLCGSLYSVGKYFQIIEENKKELESQIEGDIEIRSSQISSGNISSLNIQDLSKNKEQQETEVDIYRDTALRYLGYANEVGEAFRPLVPSLIVSMSYLLAFGYIFADSYSKGSKADKSNTIGVINNSIPNKNPLTWKFSNYSAAIDCLAFQVMASVVFPSSIINRSVHFSAEVLQDVRTLYSMQLDKIFESIEPSTVDAIFNYLPTAVGLLLIPVICPPLDILTERVLDSTLRSQQEQNK